MPNEEISSESKFIWKLIFHILITPFTLILVLLKKKDFGELFSPFKDIFKFVFEPKFTISIIIINILIFFISRIFFSETFFLSLISYPSDLFTSHFYTIITCGFLHASISHLLWNSLALFIFGRVVEREFGALKAGMIYFGALLISGVFSSLINLYLGNNIGGLGASGAIMGLVAAAMISDPVYITYELIIPVPIMIAGAITMFSDITGLLSGVNDGIGHLDHLGGYLSITLIIFFLSGEDKSKMKKGLIINLVSLLVFALFYFFFLNKYF